MRLPPVRARLLPGVLLALAAAPTARAVQGAPSTEVVERRLANGVRILSVERPSGGAVHAKLLVRLGGLPPAVSRLLAASLFGTCPPGDLGPEDPVLESLLAREEGLHEELRLQRLKAGRGATAAPADLAEAHRGALEALEGRSARGLDAVEALGASSRVAQAGPDHLLYGVDLPRQALPAWCTLEASRLARARLSALPALRAAAVSEADRGGDPARAAFLGVAFPGHPYGQAGAIPASALDAVGLEEARTFALRALHPENLLLVLVGDVGLDGLVPALETTFGALASEARVPLPEILGPELAPGARRLQLTLPGPPRLLMGWRMPPRSHPDTLGLRILARLLAGGPSGRFRALPLEERGILASLRLSLGEPGARDGGLLLVEAAPAEGHSLAEAEQALTSEVLRIQQEPIQEEEALGAQRLLLLDALVAQEDAAAFAQALGEAWSQAGAWQSALLDPARLKPWDPEELRRVARAYLSPERSVVAYVEPDVLDGVEDPLDLQLQEAVRAMARQKVDDPAAVDALVRQTIRQLRMLPRSERESVLDLLRPKDRP